MLENKIAAISTKEISQATGTTPSQARRSLYKLYLEGYVMWFNPEYERNARVGSYYWEPNWDRLEANDKETIEFYEGRERIVNAYYKMKTKELAEICRNMDLSPDGKTKEAFIFAIIDNQGLLG